MKADRDRRTRPIGAIVVAVLATAALTAVALIVPEQREPAFQAYVLLLAALIVQVLVRSIAGETSARGPLPFDLALRAPPPSSSALPAELTSIDALLRSATFRNIVFYHQVRPRLQELARHRLSAGHGVALEDVDAARRLLGEEAWAVLRPDLEPPEDRFGPGVGADALERVVDALEHL